MMGSKPSGAGKLSIDERLELGGRTGQGQAGCSELSSETLATNCDCCLVC